MKVAYSVGVLLIVPFVILYGCFTALVGAVDGAAQLLTDIWK